MLPFSYDEMDSQGGSATEKIYILNIS